MGRKANRYIYWTPRILSILFIIFLTIFSLDVITPEASFTEIAIGLLMHNIPAIVLLITVIVSWKHEIVGGIAFIFGGVLYIIFASHAGIPWYMVMYHENPTLDVGFRKAFSGESLNKNSF